MDQPNQMIEAKTATELLETYDVDKIAQGIKTSVDSLIAVLGSLQHNLRDIRNISEEKSQLPSNF